MNEFKTLITTYKGYYTTRKQADLTFKTEMDKTKDYNPTVAAEKQAELKGKYNTDKVAARHHFNDSLATINKSVCDFVGSKFSMSLTPEDEATLSNLEKIELTEDEVLLQYEKFKKNPLALRRLNKIMDDMELPESVDFTINTNNAKNSYDYYISQYNDFEGLAIQGAKDLDGSDPMQVEDEYHALTANIILDALQKELPEIEKVFEPLEQN